MRIRVTVDAERCTGHGRCYTLAPEVFEPDDAGYCHIPREELDESLAGQARTGADNCPEDAITVEER